MPAAPMRWKMIPASDSLKATKVALPSEPIAEPHETDSGSCESVVASPSVGMRRSAEAVAAAPRRESRAAATARARRAGRRDIRVLGSGGPWSSAAICPPILAATLPDLAVRCPCKYGGVSRTPGSWHPPWHGGRYQALGGADRRRQRDRERHLRADGGDRQVRDADDQARLRRLDHARTSPAGRTSCSGTRSSRSSSSPTRAGRTPPTPSLIIDAMDVLYADNVEGFAIVSSDSDFTRLATRLRESGKTVYGLGRRDTPDAFVKACDRFIYLDLLGAEPAKAATAPTSRAPAAGDHRHRQGRRLGAAVGGRVVPEREQPRVRHARLRLPQARRAGPRAGLRGGQGGLARLGAQPAAGAADQRPRAGPAEDRRRRSGGGRDRVPGGEHAARVDALADGAQAPEGGGAEGVARVGGAVGEVQQRGAGGPRGHRGADAAELVLDRRALGLVLGRARQVEHRLAVSASSAPAPGAERPSAPPS